MEEISYHLETFDGPLDLLLHLIEKNKMDIFDIQIAVIAEQYCDYVSKMKFKDLDLMSSFLVEASTLLLIKSQMLLPHIKDEQGNDIDPREDFVRRLLEYKKYKDLGYTLSDYEDDAPEYMLKKPTIPKEVATYIPSINYDELLQGINIDVLNQIFVEILKRKENSFDQIRGNFGAIQKEKLPLKDYIISVLDEVKVNKKISFRYMLESKVTKSEVIVTFLALLELIKMGKVTISQNFEFGDIDILDVNDNEKEIDFSSVEDL